MKLKIINLNILHGGRFMDNLLHFLKNANADILCLQEVYNGTNSKWERRYRTVEVLQLELSLPYVRFAAEMLDRADFGKVDQGNAIFSKFPLEEKETIFYDVPYGEYSENEENAKKDGDFTFWPHNLQHVIVQLPHKNLHLFNTHGIWGLDGGDNPRRIHMSNTIIDQIQDMDSVILAGDFNLRPATQTIQNIQKHLKNVFKDELVSTFNMKQKKNPGYATAVVDMVFVSSDIAVAEHCMPQVDISDHLPLIVTIEV